MKTSKKILLVVALILVMALVVSLFFLKKDVKSELEKSREGRTQETTLIESPPA